MPRSLRCSFCGRDAASVGQLLAAGASGAYICGDCVTACTRILEAVPDSATGWDGLSDTALLGSLPVADQTASSVREVLQAQVEALRARGISWEKIGAALGISRQAAWERFS